MRDQIHISQEHVSSANNILRATGLFNFFKTCCAVPENIGTSPMEGMLSEMHT